MPAFPSASSLASEATSNPRIFPGRRQAAPSRTNPRPPRGPRRATYMHGEHRSPDASLSRVRGFGPTAGTWAGGLTPVDARLNSAQGPPPAGLLPRRSQLAKLGHPGPGSAAASAFMDRRPHFHDAVFLEPKASGQPPCRNSFSRSLAVNAPFVSVIRLLCIGALRTSPSCISLCSGRPLPGLMSPIFGRTKVGVYWTVVPKP